MGVAHSGFMGSFLKLVLKNLALPNISLESTSAQCLVMKHCMSCHV